MRVGNIVKLGCGALAKYNGQLGVCYEAYGTGVGIIFEGGLYREFDNEHFKPFGLKIMGHCREVENYKFTNVFRLYRDFKKGRFQRAFELGKPLSCAEVIPFPEHRIVRLANGSTP